MASSFLRFLDHTRRTTVGRTQTYALERAATGTGYKIILDVDSVLSTLSPHFVNANPWLRPVFYKYNQNINNIIPWRHYGIYLII